MTRTEIDTNKVVWKISVPREMDEAVRLYLASQEEKTDALSNLVQKAVSCYCLRFLPKPKGKCVTQAYCKMNWKKLLTRALHGQKSNQNECAF